MTGKLALVSIERLVEFLGALGCEVTVQLKAPTRGPRRKAICRLQMCVGM